MKINNCFVCDKELENCNNPEDINTTPDNAVLFYGYGNYGSQVWDSISNDTYCLLYICDECFTARKNKLVYVRQEITQTLKEIKEEEIEIFK